MSTPMPLEDVDWHDDAVATIRGLALSQSVFSADDLRREMRTAPTPSMVGAAFSAARKACIIQRVGDKPSATKSRNHGLILRHHQNFIAKIECMIRIMRINNAC